MLGGAIFILGAALSLTLALGQRPSYESEVVLLYQEMISQSVLQGRDVVKSSRSLSSRYKEMLISRTQLRKIVEHFNMYPGVVDDEGMIGATEVLRSRLVFKDNGTGTFRIIYRGETREEAQQVAEMLATQLIKEDNRVRQLQANATRDFLITEKNEAEDDLKKSERALAVFLAEHPEFAEETATASAGAAIRVIQNDKKKSNAPAPKSGAGQLGALLRQRSRTQALLDNPNTTMTMLPPPTKKNQRSPEIAAAEKVVALAQRDFSSAKAKFAAAQAKYTNQHPDYRSAQNAVASTERALAAARAAVPTVAEVASKPVPIDRDALRKQLAALDTAIAAARRRGSSKTPAPVAASNVALDLVEIETLWTKLIRATAQHRERVERLESRVFTANITASSEFADASQLTVIDEAFLPPAPAGRSRKLVAFAGAFFFALLGVALALGLALIDDRIFRRGEIESVVGLPVMAVVPETRSSILGRMWRRADAARNSEHKK